MAFYIYLYTVRSIRVHCCVVFTVIKAAGRSRREAGKEGRTRGDCLNQRARKTASRKAASQNQNQRKSQIRTWTPERRRFGLKHMLFNSVIHCLGFQNIFTNLFCLLNHS